MQHKIRHYPLSLVINRLMLFALTYLSVFILLHDGVYTDWSFFAFFFSTQTVTATQDRQYTLI